MNPGLLDSMYDTMSPLVNDWDAYCKYLTGIVFVETFFQDTKIKYREKIVVDTSVYYPDLLADQVWGKPSADSL